MVTRQLSCDTALANYTATPAGGKHLCMHAPNACLDVPGAPSPASGQRRARSRSRRAGAGAERRLVLALDTLPFCEQTALRLLVHQGCWYPEIATLMDIESAKSWGEPQPTNA